MKARIVSLLSAVALLGCPEKKAAPEVHEAVAVVDASVPAPRVAKTPVKVTLLVTGAENGYLLATPDEGQLHGGAAETAARLVDEGHCAGPLGAEGAPACPNDATVLFSTGDNANGQSISSYFKGESAAQVMNAMGYAGSALGNREFDWPREQFLANVKTGGFPYLSANLTATDDEAKKLGLLPFRIVERAGVKVGIIGLSSRRATLTPMPGRMAGLTLVADEGALNGAVTTARAQGATLLAVATDGCLNDMAALLEAHHEWNLALVAGRKCDEPFPENVGLTRLVYPGRHFNNYVKAVVTMDTAATGADQLFAVEASTVEVVSPAGTVKTEEKTAALVAEWKKKLDAALGGDIGFSKDGIDQESAEMAQWLTRSLKERFKTDVALLNRKGVRQSVPAGKITRATIYDAIPFDNQILVLKLSGAALIEQMANMQARAAGLTSKDGEFFDSAGKKIDPKKIYTVATTDYLYMGGDGFKLNGADANPTATKVSWQQALIDWTAGKKSSPAKPLDAMIVGK